MVKTFAEADEVVLYIRGSKTDQYNAGEVRNQFASGGDLCVVRAWREYERHFPQRLAGSESRLPLARDADGSYIKRETVQARLAAAAAAFGVDRSKMGSHSLRIGGATALYHVTGDLQVVRRFGRCDGASMEPGGGADGDSGCKNQG